MYFVRDLLSHAARFYNKKTAFIDDIRVISWEDIAHRSMALASAMQKKIGVLKGDRSGILSFDRIEAIEHLLACSIIGATRVGINRGFSVREMMHVIEDSGLKTIFVDSDLLGIINEKIPTLHNKGIKIIGIGKNGVAEESYDDLIEKYNNICPDYTQLDHFDDFMISYTSGTTGFPKGVIIHQKGVVDHIIHTILAGEFLHSDIWFNPTATAWVTVLLNLLGLGNGLTSVLPGKGFDANTYLDIVQNYKVTRGVLAPTMLARVIQAQKSNPRDTSSLTSIMLGSAPAPLATQLEAFDLFKIPFCQWYATTETSWGALSALKPEEAIEAIRNNPNVLLSVGKPSIHIKLSIRDENGNEVDDGEVGEVWIKGDIIAKGYNNLPKETSECFKDGWFRSNDLGKLDSEGFLYLVDRKKYMIISGGANVYPAAVETVLSEHPSVREVAVVGVPDPEWGQVVVAFVIPKNDNVDESEIIDFAKENLARWEVPKRVFIVEDFPRGPTMKVKKENLIEWAKQHV